MLPGSSREKDSWIQKIRITRKQFVRAGTGMPRAYNLHATKLAR